MNRFVVGEVHEADHTVDRLAELACFIESMHIIGFGSRSLIGSNTLADQCRNKRVLCSKPRFWLLAVGTAQVKSCS